jgi:hypothetical protein
MRSLLFELYRMMAARRKLLLLPFLLVLVLLGGLLALAQGSVVAPFIYAIF